MLWFLYINIRFQYFYLLSLELLHVKLFHVYTIHISKCCVSSRVAIWGVPGKLEWTASLAVQQQWILQASSGTGAGHSREMFRGLGVAACLSIIWREKDHGLGRPRLCVDSMGHGVRELTHDRNRRDSLTLRAGGSGLPHSPGYSWKASPSGITYGTKHKCISMMEGAQKKGNATQDHTNFLSWSLECQWSSPPPQSWPADSSDWPSVSTTGPEETLLLRWLKVGGDDPHNSEALGVALGSGLFYVHWTWNLYIILFSSSQYHL